jgi:hypothetical protein
VGSLSNDIIELGLGDDTVISGWNFGSGSDTYVYSRGDGNDIIKEQTYGWTEASSVASSKLLRSPSSCSSLRSWPGPERHRPHHRGEARHLGVADWEGAHELALPSLQGGGMLRLEHLDELLAVHHAFPPISPEMWAARKPAVSRSASRQASP